MKTLLLISVLVMSFAGLAGASVVDVNCSVLEMPNSGPLLSNTCSATADPGFYISSVTFTITSDYTGYQSGNPVVTETYTLVSDTAGFGSIPDGVVTTTGISGNAVQNFGATLTGDFGASVTESFNMSNTVSGGAVTGTSGVGAITALETPLDIPLSTPEPATTSLIGGALLTVSLLIRRTRR